MVKLQQLTSNIYTSVILKTVTHGISWPPRPHDSIFGLLPKRNFPLKVVSWLMVQALARLIESCKLIDHPGVTGFAVGKSSLRLFLPTLDPAQQPHPGKHLRQGERQGEDVGNIVITTWTKFLFETPPLQGTHAPLPQGDGGSATLVQPSRGGDGDGGRPLVPPRPNGFGHSC